MKNKLAIIIPALNEAPTIGKVVGDFKRIFPEAQLVVVDNNSTDDTVALAKHAGAQVIAEKKRGKGLAVRCGLSQVQADYYLIVDGDDTYPAEAAPELISSLEKNHAEMVIGTRLENFQKENKQALHSFGNKFFVALTNLVFHTKVKDIFSGYRVLTSSYLAQIPLLAEGFDLESEMTIQALQKGLKVVEVPINYRSRPTGSYSKLHTWSDGWKVLLAIFSIFRDYRPMAFFSLLAGGFFLLGLFFGTIVILDYLEKGIVTRVPFAILTTLLIILGANCFIGGFIVSAINRRFAELRTLNKK